MTEAFGDLGWQVIRLILPFCALMLASCSSLPVPQPRAVTGSDNAALSVLAKSAKIHGNPWSKYRRVEVAYEGEWGTVATKLQPVLTDPEFRKSSIEVYQPRQRQVSQIHSGPQGSKRVHRENQSTAVSFNGKRSADHDAIAAAALVSDAYTIFLFGPSWLSANGRDFHLLAERQLDQEICQLVGGRLAPGIGSETEDHFVVWIGKDSGLMKRFQFSLNALDTTRGADVDVTFSGHWKARDGSIWPSRFVEYIQRPILAKAHDWKMTALILDSQRMK